MCKSVLGGMKRSENDSIQWIFYKDLHTNLENFKLHLVATSRNILQNIA